MDLMSAMLADLCHSYAPESSTYEDRYEVALDIPGFTPEDISVEADSGVLTVKGLSQKRGKFTRRYTLPRSVNSDGITANLEHGVLTVTVPKAETARTKKILVQSPSQALPEAKGEEKAA